MHLNTSDKSLWRFIYVHKHDRFISSFSALSVLASDPKGTQENL